MALILNLPGAIQAVTTAGSNVERVQATCRLTEEFYRTLGILLYSRFTKLEDGSAQGAKIEVRILIKNHLARPSFETWQKLAGVCGDALVKAADPLAAEFNRVLREPLRDDQVSVARAGLAQIALLRGGQVTSPAKLTRAHVLEAMRGLRNFRGHEWDNNELLSTLVRTGITELIIEELRAIFGRVALTFVVPISITEHELEVMVFDGQQVSRRTEPREKFPTVVLGPTYFRWGDADSWTENSTRLLKALGDHNRMFVYLHRGDGDAFEGQHLSLSGHVEKEVIWGGSLWDLFDLAKVDLDEAGALETLIQRFGRMRLTGECIHNMPSVTEEYVPRPKVEGELVAKLSHRKLYLIAVDGGGGFGKTELAKKVVWDLVNQGAPESVPKQLRFKFVVFVTGKTEVFRDKEIQPASPSFKTVEDLVDSILYVTGDTGAIQLELKEKTPRAIAALNKSSSTLLLLDNLDTVPAKDEVWDFLLQLGNQAAEELRVLTTSRLKGNISEQRVNLRKMEPEEALKLVSNEMARLDLPPRAKKAGVAEELVGLTGSIPLMIRHSIRLLAGGYSMEDLRRNVPTDSDQALEFICGLQWRMLVPDAQKLLLSVAYWGGRQSFSEARLVTSFSEKDFFAAREQLQEASFLLDDTLIDSMLSLLPPITQFSLNRLRESPEFEVEFGRAKRNLIPLEGAEFQSPAATLVSSDIALNQIFTRVDLLTQRGAYSEAHHWLVVATDRFPHEVEAWERRGDFEFRHLNDEASGTHSFEQAVRINPRHLTTLSDWAHWEYVRGLKHSDKLAFQHSIELRSGLIDSTTDVTLIRNSRLHIAKAYLKLAQVARDEVRSPVPGASRTTSLAERDESVLRALKILDEASIDHPRNSLDMRHNCSVLVLRADAYLHRGDRRSAEANDYNLEALVSILKGLKIDGDNGQLLSMLNHPYLRPLLERLNGGPIRGPVRLALALSFHERAVRELKRR